MRSNKVRMWVHPDFKKLIKRKAIDVDKDVLKFTKELADNNDIIENKLIKGIKKINENWGRLI